MAGRSRGAPSRGINRRALLQGAVALGSGGLWACASSASVAKRAPGEAERLEAAIAAAQKRHDLVALAVVVAKDGHVIAASARGARVVGEPKAVQVQGPWHIGSCTKSMCATLIGVYVRRGKAEWTSTLAELFPERAGAMHEGAARIELRHLCSSTAGLPENPSYAEDEATQIREVEALIAGLEDPSEQRLAVLEQFTRVAPLTAPGTQFRYSNTGYILAGAACERLGGAPFEALLQSEVWTPLGIEYAGFGAPQSADAPWGHLPDGLGVRPVAPSAAEADNPSLFASAGGVHITMNDWLLYAQEQVAGARGEGRLLSQEDYARLHTPVLDGGVYALGWGVRMRDGRPNMITHNGSNGLWYADVRAFLTTGHVFLMATNDGREDRAGAAFKEMRSGLMTRYGLT